MAPLQGSNGALAGQLVRSARAAVVAAGPEVARLATRNMLSTRSLTVSSDAQKVTLGIIAVYVVVIAILWNLPYVRWSLWPFKVYSVFPLPSPALWSRYPCLAFKTGASQSDT
jgi:hypothetical protein